MSLLLRFLPCGIQTVTSFKSKSCSFSFCVWRAAYGWLFKPKGQTPLQKSQIHSLTSYGRLLTNTKFQKCFLPIHSSNAKHPNTQHCCNCCNIKLKVGTKDECHSWSARLNLVNKQKEPFCKLSVFSNSLPPSASNFVFTISSHSWFLLAHPSSALYTDIDTDDWNWSTQVTFSSV